MSDPPWRLPLKLRGKRNWQSLYEATVQSEESDVAPTTPATGPNRGEEASASSDVQVVQEIQAENGPFPPLPASSTPNPSPSADRVPILPRHPLNRDNIPDPDAAPPGGDPIIPTASRPEVGNDMNVREPFEDDCALEITLDSDSECALVIDEGPDVPDEVLVDSDAETGDSLNEPANHTSAPERASFSPGRMPSAPAFQEDELPRKRMKLATSSEASRSEFGIGSESAGVYSSQGSDGHYLDNVNTPMTMTGEGYLAYVNAEIERRLRESSPDDSAQRRNSAQCHPNDSAQPDHSRQPNNSAQPHPAMVEGSSSEDSHSRAPTPAPSQGDPASSQGALPNTDDPDDRPPPLMDVRTMDGYPFRCPIPGPVSGLPPGLRPPGMNCPPFRQGHFIGPSNSNGASQAVGAMPSTSYHLSALSGHVSRFGSANQAGPSYRAMQPPGYLIPPPVRNPNSGNSSQPPWDPRLAAMMRAGPSQAHQQPNRMNNASEESASSYQMQMPPGDQRSLPPVAHSNSGRPDHAPRDPRLAAQMQAGSPQAHQQPNRNSNFSEVSASRRQMQTPPGGQRSLPPVAHSNLGRPDHAPRDPRLAAQMQAGSPQAHQQPNRNSNFSEVSASRRQMQTPPGDQRSLPPVAHSNSGRPDHAPRDPRLAARMHAGPPQAHQQHNQSNNFSEVSASSRQMQTPPGDQRSLPPVAHSNSGRPDHAPRDPRLAARMHAGPPQAHQQHNQSNNFSEVSASSRQMQTPPGDQRSLPPVAHSNSGRPDHAPRDPRLAARMHAGPPQAHQQHNQSNNFSEVSASSCQMQTPPGDQRSMPSATRPNLGNADHAPMHSHIFMRGGPPQPPIRISSASAASLSSIGLQPLPPQFIVKPCVGNPNSSDSGQVPRDPCLAGMEQASRSQVHQNPNWNSSSDKAGTSVQMQLPPSQDVSTPLSGEPNSCNSNLLPRDCRWVVEVQQGTPQVHQPASQFASPSEASASNCQMKIPHPGPINSSPLENPNSGNSSQLLLEPHLESMRQSCSSQPLQCPNLVSSAIGAGTSDPGMQMPHHRNTSMLPFKDPHPSTSSQLLQDPLLTTMTDGRPTQPEEHPNCITNGAVAVQIQQCAPEDLSIPSARNQCPGSSSQLSQDSAAVVQGDTAPPVFKIPVCPPKSKPVRSQSKTKQKPKSKQNLCAGAMTNGEGEQRARFGPPGLQGHQGPVAAGGVLMQAENRNPPVGEPSGSAEVVLPPRGSEASRPLEAPPNVSPPIAQASNGSSAGPSSSMAGNARPRSQKPTVQKCNPSGSSKLVAPTGGSSGSGSGHPGPSGSSSGSQGPGARNGSTTGFQNHCGRKGKSSVSSNPVSQSGSSSGSQSSRGKRSDPSGSRDSRIGLSDAGTGNGSPVDSALQVTPRPQSEAYGSPIPVLEPTTDGRTQHIVVIDSLLDAFAGRGVLTPKEKRAVKLRRESEARVIPDASSSQPGTSASASYHTLPGAQAHVDGPLDRSNASSNVAGPSNQVAEASVASFAPAGPRQLPPTVVNGPVDVESLSTAKNCGKATGLGSDEDGGIAVPSASASVSPTDGIGVTDRAVPAVARTPGIVPSSSVREVSRLVSAAQNPAASKLADASGRKNNTQKAAGRRSASTTSLGPPTVTPSASSPVCGASTAGSSLPALPKISSGITVVVASTAAGPPSAASASTSSSAISWAMAGYPQGGTQNEVGETLTALTPMLAVPVSAVQSAMSSQSGPSGHMGSSVAGPPKKAKRPPAKPKPAAKAKSQKGATRSYKPRAKKSKTPAASQPTHHTNQHSTSGGMRSSNPDLQSVGPPHGPYPGPQPSMLVTAAPGNNFLQYGAPTGSGPGVGGYVMPQSNITACYAGNPAASVANGVKPPNSSNNFGYPANWNVAGTSTAVNTIPSGAHQNQAAAWGQMDGPSQMSWNHAAQYPTVSCSEAPFPSGGPQRIVAGHPDPRAASVSQTVPPYPPPPYSQPPGVAPRQAAGNPSIRPAPPPVSSIALPTAGPSNSGVSQNQTLYGQYPSSGGISFQARPTTGPPLLHLLPPASVHYQAFSMDMRNTVGGQCGGSVTLRLSPISLPTAGPSGGNFQFPANQVPSSNFPQSGIQSVGHGAMAGLPPPRNLLFPPATLQSQVVGVNYGAGAAPPQHWPVAVSTAGPSSGNFRPPGNQAVAGQFLPAGVTFYQSGSANSAPLPHLLPSSSQFYTHAVGTINQAPGSQHVGPTTYHLSTAAPSFAGPSSTHGHPGSHVPAGQSAPSGTQSEARTGRRLPLLLPAPPPIYTKAAGVNMRHGAHGQASGARIPHPPPAIPPTAGLSSGNLPRNGATGSQLNQLRTVAQPVPPTSQSILAQLLTSPPAPIVQSLNVHHAGPRTLLRSAAVEHGLEQRHLAFSRTSGAHGVQQQEPNGFPLRPSAGDATRSRLLKPSGQDSVRSNATNSQSSGLPSPSLSTPGTSELSSSSNPSPSSSGSEGSSGIATLLDAANFLDARANGGSGESDAPGASGPAGIVQAYFIYQIALEIVGLQQMFATKGKRSIEMKADVDGLNVDEEEDDHAGALAAIVGIPSDKLRETMKMGLHRRSKQIQDLSGGNPDTHSKQCSTSWVDDLLNGAVSESETDGRNIGSEPVGANESFHGAIGICSMGNILRPSLQQCVLAAAGLLAFHFNWSLCLLVLILGVTLLQMLPNVLGSANLTFVYGIDVFEIVDGVSYVIGRGGIDGEGEDQDYDLGIITIQKFMFVALFVVLMSTTILLDRCIQLINGSSETQFYVQTLEVKLSFRCTERPGRPSDIVICSFVWNQVQLGRDGISEYLLMFVYLEASNPFEETCDDCEVQD